MDDGTFPKLFRKKAKSLGDKIALREKDKGIWSPKTWNDLYLEAEALSLGLIELGLQKLDVVAFIGDNRPEYWIGFLAAQCIGGINLGIYQDSNEEEIKYYLNYADVKFAIVEDQEQVDKLLNIKENTDLTYIIVDDWKGLRGYDQPGLIKFKDVQKKGLELKKSKPSLFDESINQTRGEDIAFLATTSGTTGKPKLALLTYTNSIEMANSFEKVIPVYECREIITYLPLAWILEQTVSICWFLKYGFIINFPEEPETVRENIREVGPDMLIAPPRIWENMCSEVQVKISESSFLKRAIVNICSPLGYKLVDKKFGQGKMNIVWNIIDIIIDFFAFRPIKDKLGLSRVKFAFTGGAPLGPEIFNYFQAIGLNLLQMYGQTEAGGMVCTHRLRDVRYETVGRPVPGLDLKISDKGEILIKSVGTFKGYYKMPDETSKVMVDGWLHTTDRGIIDDGHLIMVDRMKDVMKLNDGTSYSPSLLENKLKFNPYIREAVVFGQSRPYVVAIIQIDYQNVGHWAEKMKIEYTTFTDLAQNEKVYNLVKEGVQRINENLPAAAQIKKFILIKKELDADDEEVTRTQKIRRKFVAEKYKEQIDGMYNEKQANQ